MGTGKQYDEEFKKQAIKLAKEIGTKVSLVPQLLTMLFAFLYISSERIITGPSPLSC